MNNWTVSVADDGRIILRIVTTDEDGVETLVDSRLTPEQAEELAEALRRKAAITQFRENG